MHQARFAFVLVLASAGAAVAQPAIATAPPAASLTTTAVRATEAPMIDGDVAGDPAWANATPITAFWQEQPDEGQPASERTEVRVIFTADTLVHRRDPVRSRARRHRRVGRAPRRAADRHRQLPDHRGHLPRSPERVRVRHQPGRRRVRRPGDQRGRGRRRPGRRPDAVERRRARASTSTGTAPGRCARRSTEQGWTAEFAIPFRTLRYPVATRSDLGHQLPAQHPAPQRARVLGADPAAVQPVSSVAGRFAGRRPDARAAQPPHHAVRPRQRARVRRQTGRIRPARRRRRRPEVQPDAEPDARRAP